MHRDHWPALLPSAVSCVSIPSPFPSLALCELVRSRLHQDQSRMGGVLLPLGGNKGLGDTLVEGVALDRALARGRQPPSDLGQDHLLVAEAVGIRA